VQSGTFTRRYVAWLTLPPALVTIPLAFLFISQVVRLTAADATIILVLLAAIYAIAALVYATTLSGATCDFEDAVAEGGDIATGMSRCLERTRAMTVVALSLGGLLFAAVATITVMRTIVGFAYFATGALIATFPGVAWAYAAGKQQLVRTAAGVSKARYVGRELSVGRKIAIVFIGSFLIALIALVELVSSKVSVKLEQLAIASASERFERIYDTTNLAAQITPGIVDDLRNYIPAGYSLHLIEPSGRVTSTSNPLTPDEVVMIRRVRTGDSASFASPHVMKFRSLKDGSILALGIPWEPYRNIPLQVAWYTLIVALITTAIFILATIILARDVSAPIRELRTLAAAMAQGNFEARTRIFSDDEIGQLANSFADTRSNLRRLFGRIGTSGATITHGVGVISGGTETLLNRAHEQAQLTEQANAALENVRTRIRNVLNAGDTVASLTQDASSRALELQASAEEVARSTSNLFQSVEKTSSSTTEMDQSMREMSKRTDVLAGIGDQVLSFVSEMNATADELRKAAQTTADISRQVRVDAEAGGEAVAKTVEGITATRELTASTAETFDALQKSVAQISQILTVIEDVAGRTNLLALNAAIIAAQAGEHGAGFSVVADEIRELAERTRGSTKEINAIVKAVQAGSRAAVAKVKEGVSHVEYNVGLADNASASLKKIVESASRSYEMAIKIAQALGDQALASRHLHEATSRMSDHITEINRAVREQATGTEMLAAEAERVREIAGQVKRATDEQSQAGRGITAAMEKIADDAKQMRDSLERQLRETDRIAEASRTMLDIAQQNDALARQFNSTLQNLVASGRDFEAEVARFRIGTNDT
jgi:methyl-accepting chemotaxis protein